MQSYLVLQSLWCYTGILDENKLNNIRKQLLFFIISKSLKINKDP